MIRSMIDIAWLMCDIGRRATLRELVAGTEGNFSARLDSDRILCTPTFRPKGVLRPDELCVIDEAGAVIEGLSRPSSEIRLHLAIYRACADIGAVVHTHPPYATAYAIVGESPPTGVLQEADIFFPTIPVVDYETTGTDALGAAVARFAAETNAVLLSNHGAVSWGPDLETAYALTEMLEAFCRATHLARQIGSPQSIPPEKRPELDALGQRIRASWKRNR